MRTTKNLTVSLPPAMLREMVRTAKRENRTLSELVRENFRRSQQQPDLYALIRQIAPAPAALQNMWEEAKRNGTDKLTMAEINREVAAVRKQAGRKKKAPLSAGGNDRPHLRHPRHQHRRIRQLGRRWSVGRYFRLALNQRLIQMCVSPAVLAEYEKVLRRPRFKFTTTKVDQTLTAIRAAARLVNPTKALHISPDEADNRFTNVPMKPRPTT